MVGTRALHAERRTSSRLSSKGGVKSATHSAAARTRTCSPFGHPPRALPACTGRVNLLNIEYGAVVRGLCVYRRYRLPGDADCASFVSLHLECSSLVHAHSKTESSRSVGIIFGARNDPNSS